jgi:pimeloyl-ACP methyl ester carboxylesterase
MILAVGAILFILLAFSLGILLAIRSADRREAVRWLQQPSVKGQLISAGSQKLFCRVEGRGEPTVVILSGWSSCSAEWWPIQDQLAQFTRVVTYDRAGYSWSETARSARTSTHAVEDLHALLQTAELPPPYLLLGHSLGGLYAQQYARKYPMEIAGIVLADPVSPDDHLFDELNCPGFEKFAAANTRRGQVHHFRRLAAWGWMRFKMTELRQAPSYGLYQTLPADVQEIFWQNFALLKFWNTVAQEYDRKILAQDIRDLNSCGPFPTIPLRMIVRNKQKAVEGLVKGAQLDETEAQLVEDLHERLMRELMKLSPHSEWISASGGSHMLHLTEPETIIQAVKSILHEIRST